MKTLYEFNLELDAIAEEMYGDSDNNPYTALCKFLGEHEDFVSDKNIEKRLLMSCQPNGYIYRK
jgi:cephalosporin hydroxylase